MIPTLTNKIETLPVDYVAKYEYTDEYGLYSKDRVTTPIQPTVVRQDSPEGPNYQEAIGYQFLLTSMKFPGLVRMDDGRMVLSATYENKPGLISPGGLFDDVRTQPVIFFSDDEGRSWSQPRPTDMFRALLINLGGKKLMSYGDNHSGGGANTWFSEDAGESWSEPEVVPPLPDGRACWSDLCYYPLVEGCTVYFIFYTTGPEPNGSLLRRYHTDSHTWDDPVFIPKHGPGWSTSEGAVVRAQNGDLVAAFRSGWGDKNMPEGAICDHWRGISTRISKDNGKTWSDPAYHFHVGHLHSNLLALPDGRILMTYAARIGELEGMNYHGIEAVLSHDNGVTWDWERRYILFRWPLDQGMHSPQSKLLSDGRILTIFMHSTSFPWTDGEAHSTENGVNVVHVGNVSVVIWRP